MAAEDRPTRTHLSDLVRDRRAALRISLVELEERAVDPESGKRVPSSWIHRLERGEAAAPGPDRLRGLAVGLGEPLAVVQEAAAAQYFGIDSVWSTSGEIRALVERAERLTPEQIAQVRRLIETLAPDPPDAP